MLANNLHDRSTLRQVPFHTFWVALNYALRRRSASRPVPRRPSTPATDSHGKGSAVNIQLKSHFLDDAPRQGPKTIAT